MPQNTEAEPTACVTSPYQRVYDDPIVMQAADEIRVEREDEEGPGWWWCVHPDGRSGWVFETFFERDGPRGVALRDYSALELTVDAGEDLTLHELAGGWYWATNIQGKSGWVPAEKVELQEET